MSAYRYDYLFPVVLTGTRAEVFAALSRPEALSEWFAEHVEIGSGAGEPFRFWGRYTFGVPGTDSASQAITGWTADQSVSFSWHVLGQDTEVTWQIEEETSDDEPVLKLRVIHEFAALPEETRAEALIDDLWRIHVGNLCFYLNGQAGMRVDFADPSPVVTCQIEIDAPPSSVFAALIEPEHIKQWFPAPDPKVDPRVGGDYGFGFSFEHDGQKVEPPPLKISEFVPDKVLAMNWPDWRMDPSVPDQQIRWELEDLGDGRTRLTLRHTGFTRTTDISDYPFGWQEFVEKVGEVAVSLTA
ncbi:MAG: SRPBCC family protein [Pseudomonadota bacterium]